jgi:hypothetical protein
LPAELLLIIFELMYDDQVWDQDERWRSDNMSPSLFPGPAIATCLSW